MPEQICTQCAEKAVEMYIFKQNCERADAVLREQLGKSPFIDHSKGEEQIQYCLDDNDFEISDGDGENIIVKPEINLENDDGSSLESIIVENRVDMYNDVIYNNVVNSSHLFCNACDKKFKSEEELNLHKKVHIPKPFVCETCGKTFTRDDLLLRHKIIHALKFQEKNKNDASNTTMNDMESKDIEKVSIDDERGSNSEKEDSKKCNQCTICNKRFSKASHLKRHIKIHAAIKPYSCQLCTKGFARAEQLMNHMNAHSGIKPHVCKICSKGKNSSFSLLIAKKFFIHRVSIIYTKKY